MQRLAVAFAGVLALTVASGDGALAADAKARAPSREMLKRGEYLVGFGGCHDCHTPKIMSPKGSAPDPARMLSGHPANTSLPPVPTDALGPTKWAAVTNGDLTAWAGPWGVSYAANLTPDKRTALGDWTPEQFIKTMRTGKHLGSGRDLLPPMPWFNLNVLTDQDLRAVFAYLRSLKPIENQVPAPLPPK